MTIRELRDLLDAYNMMYGRDDAEVEVFIETPDGTYEVTQVCGHPIFPQTTIVGSPLWKNVDGVSDLGIPLVSGDPDETLG